MDPGPPRPRRLSPLTLKILGLNSLALVVLAVGLLFLGDYRRALIEQQLAAMTTEAQLIAAAMGAIAVGAAPVRAVPVDPETGAPLVPDAPAPPAEAESGPRDQIVAELARPLMRRLGERALYRAQVFARTGEMVVDTRQVHGPGGIIVVAPLPPPDTRSWLEDAANWLYDLIVDLLPRERLPPFIELPVPLITDYVDTETALRGEVATGLRDGGSGDLVLSAAVPIQRVREVLGVVFVTGDDRDIQDQVRGARFNILRVFALALAFTVLASLYLAGTIARPIRLLAQAAERVRLSRGIGAARDDAPKIPDMSRRRDEIGDLAVALAHMTDALSARVDAIERFAADVAHEVKNPLTSLKSALETLARIEDPARRAKLMQIMLDDIARIDRLLGDISTASRLDAELSRAESAPIDVAAALQALVDLHAATRKDGEPEFRLASAGGPFVVRGLADRLGQVFRNVLANAVSFSPPGGVIAAAVAREGASVVITFDDDGPGVPEDMREAIFNRFYSERPSGEKFGMHSGLGLAISRQIINAHGGTITAENRVAQGRVAGARFIIRLPAG